MVQPTNALNIIPTLPAMTWRGVSSPPYDMANVSGAHQQAERRFPYVDAASHDNTGRDPIPMQFKLYFLNSLRDNLFPDLYNQWKDAFILDGSSDDLNHPLLGVIRARPTTWSIELVAERTSGLVMDVAFVETFDDDPNINVLATVTSLSALADACDAGMAALGIPWPSGERTTSLADLLKQVQSLVFSARLTVSGIINQAIGTVDRVIDDIERITDHSRWSVINNTKELRNRLVDLGNTTVTVMRKTTTKVAGFDASLDHFVDRLNSLEDLIALNPNLLSTPIIKKGTTIVVFAE